MIGVVGVLGNKLKVGGESFIVNCYFCFINITIVLLLYYCWVTIVVLLLLLLVLLLELGLELIIVE
jgi:hypothetical protein